MSSSIDPRENARLLRWLMIALITATVIFIFRQAWEVVHIFSQIIMLFAVSWLFAFLLSPVIRYLSRHPVPRLAIRQVRRRGWVRVANALDGFRLPHALAVILVYLLVLLILVVTSVYAVPALARQLVAFGQTVPPLIQTIPAALTRVEGELSNLGITLDLGTVYEPAQLAQRAESISTQIVQWALTLATGVASALASVLLALTLSLYMNLDAPRLARQLHDVLPDHYHGQLTLVGQSISRTFGGYIRGQLLLAALYGIPVTILLGIVNINPAAIIGIISGLLMLVPLIGAPIAMIMPAAIAYIQSPSDALWLLIVFTAYQQVLLQVFAPKLMAEVVGMPPMLVLVAMLAAARVIGVWGLIFGIPIAGVIYALGLAYLEQAKIRREALPRGINDARTDGVFRLPAMGPGCLLIPDIDSSPGDLRPLAEHLAVRGITTLGIDPYRTQGQSYWEDWYAVVLPALDQLWRDCNQVFVVGEGVGAALALHAASDLPVSGVCAIAVPLTADGRHDGQRWPLEDAQTQALQVDILPTRARVAIAHLQERVHGELPGITAPVLILHPHDHAVLKPEDARYVLERLGAAHKRIEWLAAQGDERRYNWERIAQAAFAFIRDYIQ